MIGFFLMIVRYKNFSSTQKIWLNILIKKPFKHTKAKLPSLFNSPNLPPPSPSSTQGDINAIVTFPMTCLRAQILNIINFVQSTNQSNEITCKARDLLSHTRPPEFPPRLLTLWSSNPGRTIIPRLWHQLSWKEYPTG